MLNSSPLTGARVDSVPKTDWMRTIKTRRSIEWLGLNPATIHILHVAIPLATGVALYILFRSPETYGGGIFSFALGGKAPASILLADAAPQLVAFRRWVSNHAPDGLWMYSLLSFCYSVWPKRESFLNLSIWMAASLALGCFFEIQITATGLRIDWGDLAAYAVAVFCACIRPLANFYEEKPN